MILQAIKITATAIMRMRPDSITKQHVDMLNVTLDPIIAEAPDVLKRHESQNIAEDRLSLLYADLVPPNLLPKPTQQESLAQKRKNMAHVNLCASAGNSKKVRRDKSGSFDDDDEESDGGAGSEEDEEGSGDEGRHSGSGRGSLSKPGRTRSGTSSKKPFRHLCFVCWYTSVGQGGVKLGCHILSLLVDRHVSSPSLIN